MRNTIGYGRIYRITPKGEELSIPDLDLSTVPGQMEALRSPAVNVRYAALQRLITAGPAIIPEVKELTGANNPYHQARAIWLLSQLGDAGIREVEALLQHDNDDIRLVSFRALRKVNGENLLSYAGLLADDPSSWVRREVIISLRDRPLAEKKDLLLRLAEGYDGTDRWYLEALGSSMAGDEEEFYTGLVGKFNSNNVAADQWDSKLSSLVWRLHPAAAVNDLKARASATGLDDEARSQALTAIAFVNTKEAVQAMIALSKNENKLVSEQATYWLTFRQANNWFALWDWRKTGIDLERERAIAGMKVRRNRILDPKMPPAEKRSNARAMTRDAVGVQMLLGMVAGGQLPEELYPFVEQLIMKHENENVRIQAAGYFRDTNSKEDFSIQSISALKPNASKGREIFQKQCATCHQVKGKGGKIGPDLSAIGGKFDRNSLLDAVINPDAGIVFGYEAWTITLNDGQSFFGFLVADGPQTVTIRDLSGKNNVIETAKINSRKKQEKSLMPSPATLGLTGQDLADLSEYLMTM